MQTLKHIITSLTILAFILIAIPDLQAFAQETPGNEEQTEEVEEQVGNLLRQLLSLLEERVKELTSRSNNFSETDEESGKSLSPRDEGPVDQEDDNNRHSSLETAGSRGETTGSKHSSGSSDSNRRGGSRGLSGVGTTVIADKTAPVISSISVGGVTYTTATISWSTDEPATSRVNYGTDTNYGSASSSPSLTKNHSISLSGLSYGVGTYYFEVVSTDASGNTDTSTDDDGLFTKGTVIVGGDE